MSEPEAVVTFPDADPQRLAEAVKNALLARADLAEHLHIGAEHSLADAEVIDDDARRFQTFLELGYLVASADGFADEERDSLSSLLEAVTQKAIDHDVLDLHFKDLDDGVTMLGRSHRLARSAAELETTEDKEEAIELVALIAMADGTLAGTEHDVLVRLAELTSVSAERLDEIVQGAAARVKEGLQ